MLFEVAIIEKPTQKELENGASEKLVLAPTAVVARDAQAAAIKAAIDGKVLIDANRTEVLVRPFA